eukprot:gb/GFBE01024674.1/.p1 GENE.gb/GFBE01024674.1/~~gb/GFBE01024674.1/.p1  ORF type:complete len:814 (+),score=189.10 gb/GFBE01024674.1/:1-2442(+)
MQAMEKPGRSHTPRDARSSPRALLNSEVCMRAAPPQSNAWHEVLDLCKRGFAQKLEVLTSEIISDVKGEVQQAALTLRKEVSDIMLARDTPLVNKLVSLTSKIQALEETASARSAPLPPDLTPLIEQLQQSSKAQQEASKQLELRLDKMAEISEQLRASSSDASSSLSFLEVQLQQLDRKLQASDDKIQQASECFNTSTAIILKEVQSMQQQQAKHVTLLETEVTHGIAEVRDAVFSIDVDNVQEDLKKGRRQLDTDIKTVLFEISRIQQGLQLDFVQVFEDKIHMLDEQLKMEPKMEARPSLPDAIHYVNHTTRVRKREMCAQTDSGDISNQWTQTDPNMFQAQTGKARKTVKKQHQHKDEPPKVTIGGADQLAQQAKEASMRPPYNVFDYYYDTGCCQALAKSVCFDRLTLLLIALNAMWIAVDTDLNDATFLIDAHPVFIVAENTFCFSFLMELFVRFMAFEKKRNAFRDFWFNFDLLLVVMMIVETWLVTAAMYFSGKSSFNAGTGTVSMLRMLRLVKLLKLSRVAKFLRAFPELVIISKGIRYASRSVTIFFVFSLLIVYVFAVICRQLLDGHPSGQVYFHSVPGSMNSLLLTSMFPGVAKMTNEVTEDAAYMWPLLVFFFLIVSITVMYMLVGVLVEVVGVISTVEKESLTVGFVANELRDELTKLGYNIDLPITKTEFEKILIHPRIAKIVSAVGVDVDILCGMLDIIFEDAEKKGFVGMPFPSLVEVILAMRGSNPATVKDSKETLRIMKAMLADTQAAMAKKMRKEFEDLKLELQELREDIKDSEEAQHQYFSGRIQAVSDDSD